MPTEPPPTLWSFPPAGHASGEGLLAIGADLEPGTLLAAYRSGIFPMPVDAVDEMAWFSPDPRGIVPLDAFAPSRSLRRSARRFTVSADRAFADVVAGCADPRRPGGWISTEVEAAYIRLHELGWAHSVEAWRDGRLAGGLYGVAIGGLFAGESMFHRERDASKVALVGLVDLLSDEYADRRLLDVQWRTPHLARLGVVEVSRPAYLARLAEVLDTPAVRWRAGTAQRA
jgi:leucyl/phenylalanyl-tRNA---protein transferase